MKKVVFKGVINDKEFDNVQDYNAEMSRLLGTGEMINASSSTSVAEESDFDQSRRTQDKIEEPYNLNDFLPFFNSGSDQYYLDKLVSDDDELNDKNLNLTQVALDEKIEKFDKVLHHTDISLEELWDFINMLKNIKSRISEDSKNNSESITEFEKRIKTDSDNLNILKQ